LAVIGVGGTYLPPRLPSILWVPTHTNLSSDVE
jgi:hypothetical protein